MALSATLKLEIDCARHHLEAALRTLSQIEQSDDHGYQVMKTGLAKIQTSTASECCERGLKYLQAPPF